MPARPVRILVVDDEPAMRRALIASLAASGYEVEGAPNGEEAIEKVRQKPFELVLLDVNMPGLSGVDVCRRIRSALPNAGIVMITVLDALDEKVRALDTGADDYVTKPFLLRELLARLRALIRRAGLDQPSGDVLRIGSLELDNKARTVRKAGIEIHLSPTEFDLLAYLMQHCGIPIEHSKLLQAVWGPEYGSELEYLRSYVRFLRKKIESDPAHPEFILTEPWVGYRFRDPSDPAAPL